MKIKISTKVIAIIVLSCLLISNLILNIQILKNISELKADNFSMAWDISTIESNVNKVQDSIKQIDDTLYSIKSDVSDIEYYVEY